MLTNKERAFLRSYASKIKSAFKIGKEGITDNFLDQIDKYLNAHEIIKISCPDNSNEKENKFLKEIANKLNSEMVETRGSTLVLYRKSKNKKSGETLL